VTPEELASALSAAGLAMTGTEGLVYVPFSDEWRLATDTDVNYFASATRR
jgi:2-polyprenyl-6-hydroxyphenyl methylase/3-demethylubiquinone-9 3-methyltransferase